MRLTFLTHYYPPEVGAPQARIPALAEGLAEQGIAVTVHTGFPNYPSGVVNAPYRNRLLQREQQGAVRVVRSAIYPAPNSGVFRRLANHASFSASSLVTAPYAGRADVIVVEIPPLPLGGSAIAYARGKGARLILNVSDLWVDSAIDLGLLRSRAAIRLARAWERACYRAADSIVCPTVGIASHLSRNPESAGKVNVIPPSVDLAAFSSAQGATPTGNGDAQRQFRVLYAGTIGLSQGVGTLLDAAAALERSASSVEVVIVGDGAEASELRTRIQAQGPSNVRFLGVVPHERIPALYAEADAAVALLRDRPIFNDAVPTKMFEAMAASRPVVLSGAGEAARLLAASGGGIAVNPEDPIALAQALHDLATNPVEAVTLGVAGRQWVENSFGRERALEQWLQLLTARHMLQRPVESAPSGAG